jgi:hypothetical protein
MPRAATQRTEFSHILKNTVLSESGLAVLESPALTPLLSIGHVQYLRMILQYTLTRQSEALAGGRTRIRRRNSIPSEAKV